MDLDLVVTAEQANAYKPSHGVFQLAQERMRVEKREWLHVAQGRTYDIQPVHQLEIANVWVDRQTGRHGAKSVSDAFSRI